MMEEIEIRKAIKAGIIKFFALKKKQKKFVPGKSKIQYSGPVYGEEEINAIVDSLFDGWFGVGKKAKEFETAFSSFAGTKKTVLTNSGSSANLLALAALCSKQFPGHLNPGDEVITPACTFPTTINPIIQNNLRAVLIDVALGSYNVAADSIRNAVSEKTRAVVVPHTLGNPNEMDTIMELAAEKNLFVVEDAADALGAKYSGKKVGSFGTFGTFSFYVAHHITMGEGGAITMNDPFFDPIVRSIRDWGRACTCEICKVSIDPNFICEYRFDSKEDNLPPGYDKRYLYTNIGYNLKPLELQAAMGLVQLKKFDEFKKARQKNFDVLFKEFSKFEQFFILPESLPKAVPCWFAFPLTIKDNAPFSRKQFIELLDKNNIESRLLFAGNISKHPAYRDMGLRAAMPLANADKIMNNSFFIGIYPGLDKQKISFVVEKAEEFLKKY